MNRHIPDYICSYETTIIVNQAWEAIQVASWAAWGVMPRVMDKIKEINLGGIKPLVVIMAIKQWIVLSPGVAYWTVDSAVHLSWFMHSAVRNSLPHSPWLKIKPSRLHCSKGLQLNRRQNSGIHAVEHHLLDISLITIHKARYFTINLLNFTVHKSQQIMNFQSNILCTII